MIVDYIHNMNSSYDQIEKAIIYLSKNFQDQPTLEDVAAHVNLSPFHFQKLFKDWAGVSPKKFLQYISTEYAKGLLKNQLTLEEVSHNTGLSGTSRLHDLFIGIEAMTPGEFKNGGKNLLINFSIQKTPFGEVLFASTQKGICKIAFLIEDDIPKEIIKNEFPKADIQEEEVELHRKAVKFFQSEDIGFEKLKLHLKGTPFQLKVWSALLTIPPGNLTTYSSIAKSIGKPKTSRATGSAVGKNPVALIIPCHRVIRSTGVIGNYRWGSARKKAIIGKEVISNLGEN